MRITTWDAAGVSSRRNPTCRHRTPWNSAQAPKNALWRQHHPILVVVGAYAINSHLSSIKWNQIFCLATKCTRWSKRETLYYTVEQNVRYLAAQCGAHSGHGISFAIRCYVLNSKDRQHTQTLMMRNLCVWDVDDLVEFQTLSVCMWKNYWSSAPVFLLSVNPAEEWRSTE